MINQKTQTLLDKFNEALYHCDLKVDFVINPSSNIYESEILKFDIEGIEKPTMDIVTYKDLKSYLLQKIKKHFGVPIK